jgi:hypothetical protein
MKTPVDDFTSVLERLTAKVEELEARLSALEQRAAAITHPLVRPESPAEVPPIPLGTSSFPRPAAALAVGGRVFVGMAGAYLLRALAESGTVPQLAVVAVALAYAATWLVWAGVHGATGFTRAASAITAASILSPMLWELTLRFHVLPAGGTAAVLAGFAALASALAWKRNLTAVVSVATLAAIFTGLPLSVATRDPEPFVVAFLVIALFAEAAACHDRWLGLRAFTASASDLGALVLILIYTRQEGVPAEYPPLAAGVLVALVTGGFVIYGASTIFRTVVRKRTIATFEIVQTAVAFLLGAVGVLRIVPDAVHVLGAVLLLVAIAAYWAAFTRLSQVSESRNHHVFATWAAFLFLAGSILLLPVPVQGPWLALSAVTAVAVATSRSRMTIGFHGVAYLAAAAWLSGLLEYVGRTLAGGFPPAPGWSVWITAAAAVLGYAIAVRWFSEDESRNQQLLRLAYAGPAALVVTAVTVVFVVWVELRVTATAPPLLAAIRTLIMCLAALTLAFAGSRCRRIELVWLAYIAIAFCTLKLLFDDLRYGSASSIAASLFFYGMAWVFVPRAARKTPR